MTLPQAVVFDLGKVLLDFDYDIAVRGIQKRCRLSQSQLQQLINQSPLLHAYESNGISTAQFFEKIQTASGYTGTIDEFRELFADIFTPIAPMIRLHAELRRQRIPTYVFSNTNEIAIAHIRDRFPFFHEFDAYILSYEHDAMKPDFRLYEVVELTARKGGSDLLYIDDRPENIAAGRQQGWRAILHEDPAATRAAVVESGLLSE